MTTIIGADGCHAGWICIFEELPSRRLGSKVFSTIADLFAAAPQLDVLAVDIPIGLTDAGPRDCDLAARRLLAPLRASSVFPAPIRPALHAPTYLDACDRSLQAQGKRVSKQAWAIYPKIRQLDDLLRADAPVRDRVYEVHPEVSFAAWSGAPMSAAKKDAAGFAARQQLVRRHFGAGAYDAVRQRYSRGDVANDDILDAFAALWTAERILAGVAQSLPASPPLDAAGLPMRIVY